MNLHVDDPPKLPANKINHTQVEDQAADHLSNPIATVLPSIRSGFTLHSATTSDLRIVAVSDVTQ
jgi:hypothetical protein